MTDTNEMLLRLARAVSCHIRHDRALDQIDDLIADLEEAQRIEKIRRENEAEPTVAAVLAEYDKGCSVGPAGECLQCAHGALEAIRKIAAKSPAPETAPEPTDKECRAAWLEKLALPLEMSEVGHARQWYRAWSRVRRPTENETTMSAIRQRVARESRSAEGRGEWDAVEWIFVILLASTLGVVFGTVLFWAGA